MEKSPDDIDIEAVHEEAKHVHDSKALATKETDNESKQTEISDGGETDLDSLGFMFDDNLCLKKHEYTFDDSIQVIISENADHPVPRASEILAEYIVKYQASRKIKTFVELDAGAGLPSIAAFQVWRRHLQCVVITDKDPSLLEHARCNHESTIEKLLDHAATDEEMNRITNEFCSTPIIFSECKDGCEEDITAIAIKLRDRTTPPTNQVDLVLMATTDLSENSVKKVFKTATALMSMKGRFLMAHKSPFDEVIDSEISLVCEEKCLTRGTLHEEDEYVIEEFCFPGALLSPLQKEGSLKSVKEEKVDEE